MSIRRTRAGNMGPGEAVVVNNAPRRPRSGDGEPSIGVMKLTRAQARTCARCPRLYCSANSGQAKIFATTSSAQNRQVESIDYDSTRVNAQLGKSEPGPKNPASPNSSPRPNAKNVPSGSMMRGTRYVLDDRLACIKVCYFRLELPSNVDSTVVKIVMNWRFARTCTRTR